VNDLISVIIPCFNTGAFLNEAVESVLTNVLEKFEIIIVNDGSTDSDTLSILAGISDSRIRLINQDNKGLASARNIGVQHSSGSILFFLDSDNMILPNYSTWATDAFNTNPRLGVFYGNPRFIGDLEDKPRFEVQPFDFDKLLRGNFIDACAFVRKDAFLSVDGFSVDPNLQGWDDWELWIKLSLGNWDFLHKDKECYVYRVRRNSMIGSSSTEKKEAMMRYLGNKYGYVIHQKFRRYYTVYHKIYTNPFSYFFRILFYKYVLRRPFLS
jgi:glycosyltransferase involved in cell wall biosynthesis